MYGRTRRRVGGTRIWYVPCRAGDGLRLREEQSGLRPTSPDADWSAKIWLSPMSKAGDGGWSSTSDPLTPICLSNFERVQNRYPSSSDIGSVVRDQHQSVHFDRRGKQSLDERQRVRHAQERPGFSDWLVDRCTLSPSRVRICANQVQGGGLFGITAQFSWRTRTLVPISLTVFVPPTLRRSDRLFELADFGYDVRIEQELQRSTSRHFFCRGWSNTPAKASSERSEPKISKAVLT